MSVLKVVGIGCLGCLGLVVVGGIVGFVLLPDDYEVTRSIEIAAPPTAVFPLVDTPRRWSDWDPWTRLDPAMKNEYSGPESGVGAKRSWTSENDEVGRGSCTIVESVASDRVAMDLDIPDLQMTPRVTFTFERRPNGTRVTWTHADELSGGYRVFALAGNALLGPMLEGGLANLKELAEREASVEDEIFEEAEETVDDVLDEDGGYEEE